MLRRSLAAASCASNGRMLPPPAPFRRLFCAGCAAELTEIMSCKELFNENKKTGLSNLKWAQIAFIRALNVLKSIHSDMLVSEKALVCFKGVVT